MTNLLNILLMAPANGGAAGQGGSNVSFIVMMLLLIVVFYFFMIRPQSKRQKEIRKFQESLEPGKPVVTQGGIYGKIKEVQENFLIVEIADNVRIKIAKNMVFDASEPQQPQK
ncbi:MAG: preprotein translocase subunit YajC [Prevotellaceae bacterium]|jgi:preprotein translocase subunit YajC|nr:preprotein translocase subunit YajC [Prevotellaceae bacterium]